MELLNLKHAHSNSPKHLKGHTQNNKDSMSWAKQIDLNISLQAFDSTSGFYTEKKPITAAKSKCCMLDPFAIKDLKFLLLVHHSHWGIQLNATNVRQLLRWNSYTHWFQSPVCVLNQLFVFRMLHRAFESMATHGIHTALSNSTVSAMYHQSVSGFLHHRAASFLPPLPWWIPHHVLPLPPASQVTPCLVSTSNQVMSYTTFSQTCVCNGFKLSGTP